MKHTNSWWANRKIGVSRCCAVLCTKAILLSPTRELAVQSAKVLCFECILLLQINLQSLPNVSSVCMNAWTGTPNKALDLKHVQNLNSNTKETSKWCDVVNGFDEAQVCLALGDYLNCKIHTCLGGKSVKDGIKVMKSGGSTELPSGRCWVSFTLVLPGDSEKNMRNVRKKWPCRCSHHFWNSWSSPFLRWFPCWSCGSSRNFPTKWSCHEVLSMIRQQHLPVPWMTWRDVHILDAIDARLLAEVKRIKMLVLDEADEMLSKGFKEQAGKQENWHGLWEACGSWNVVRVKLVNEHAFD